MSSTINATTVGVGGVVTTADNSGILALQTVSTTALTISATQGVTLASTLGVTGATTITSASATSLAVGLNGATNPAFTIDSSTASQVAGFKITGAVTGGTVALVATDSSSNTSLTINGKGSGTIGIGSVSTGAVTITPATTITGAATLSSTLGVTGATTLSSTLAVTGITTVAAGSAALPSIISTTGTADTGFWFPAADTIAASTGGTERMRIDSSGNVGIGKTPTNKPLEIYSASNPAIRIQNSTTGTGSTDGFLLEMNSSDVYLYNYEVGNLLFGTSNTERVRITSGGLVGIGTSAPARLLSVQYPFAKTDTTTRYMFVLKSNDASNANEMLFSSVGAATQASRVWNIQTGEDGVSNAGVMALQPSGGSVTIGGVVAVTLSATQTLTNKTLTSPTLTTPVINSATITTVSGTAPLFMCRAWVNFNGTGTIAIRGSGNVSSIGDNGAGNYGVNFTTAMTDANWVGLATSGNVSSNISGIVNADNRGSGSCQIYPTVGGVDASCVDVAIFR